MNSLSFPSMAAVPNTANWISAEDYLEGELLSGLRHEYVDGCVYAMAGASADHNRIAGNVFTELSNHLARGRCEAFMSDMKVKVGPAFYYPDVMVACDPNDNAKYFRERPAIIIEVLSPETERTDRREKLLAYREIPSLQRYILLDQEHVSALVFCRNGDEWVSERLDGGDSILRLPEISFEIALSRVYMRTSALAASG